MSKKSDFDFKAVIELVKYTLALTAACFAYAVEKLVPAASEPARWLAVAILVALVGSMLGGGYIFSVATAALHPGGTDSSQIQQARIKRAAEIHLGLLALGVLLLGGKLFHQLLTEKPPVEAAKTAR